MRDVLKIILRIECEIKEQMLIQFKLNQIIMAWQTFPYSIGLRNSWSLGAWKVAENYEGHKYAVLV